MKVLKPKVTKLQKIKAKSQAYLTRSKGKAIRNQSKLRETELTRRSIARSAAYGNALSKIAESRAQQNANERAWNQIITGEIPDTQPNQNTSDLEVGSTTDIRS